MIENTGFTVLPEHVVGAIRLALEGAANDSTALALIKALCDYAPETPGDDTKSPALFLRAIRELSGHIEVVQ